MFPRRIDVLVVFFTGYVLTFDNGKTTGVTNNISDSRTLKLKHLTAMVLQPLNNSPSKLFLLIVLILVFPTSHLLVLNFYSLRYCL